MRQLLEDLTWAEKALFAFTAMLIVSVIVVAILAVRSGEPICPEGQEYVFSHNVVVGQVTVPQYVCRDVTP